MSNDTTSTCPTNALPADENLGIDGDSIYAVVPRGNTTSNDIPDAWMVGCCEPSPVRLASDNLIGTCWQWCDLPPKYTNWTSETSKMSDQFTTCITSSESYRNSSVKPNIFHVSAAARDGVAGDGMAGLALVLGLALWRYGDHSIVDWTSRKSSGTASSRSKKRKPLDDSVENLEGSRCNIVHSEDMDKDSIDHVSFNEEGEALVPSAASGGDAVAWPADGFADDDPALVYTIDILRNFYT